MEDGVRDTRTLALQLRDRLAELIQREGLKPGDKMPTEAQLTERFKISRPALREALKLLEQDNVIYVEHGRGRYVSAIAAVHVSRPITVFESQTDMTRHYGYSTTNRVLSISEERPGETIRRQLKLGEQDRVFRIERLKLDRDEPIIYCLAYVPRNLIPARLFDIDWSGSLLDLLEQHRQRPKMSAAAVSAVLLPQEVIEKNDLSDFGPALLITETCFNAVGEPVVYAMDYHRGSHFSFSFIRK